MVRNLYISKRLPSRPTRSCVKIGEAIPLMRILEDNTALNTAVPPGQFLKYSLIPPQKSVHILFYIVKVRRVVDHRVLDGFNQSRAKVPVIQRP